MKLTAAILARNHTHSKADRADCMPTKCRIDAEPTRLLQLVIPHGA